MKKLLLFFLLSIPAACFAGTTYYVDVAVGSDGNAGTSPGAGNAWATIQKALNTVAKGDLAFVKASSTYSISVGLIANAGAGSVTFGSQTRIIGYTSSPGDLGRALIQISVSTTALVIAGSGWSFENFVIDGNNKTSSQGVLVTGIFGDVMKNCLFKNWTNGAISVQNGGSFVLYGSEVTNVSGAAAALIFSGTYQSGIDGCSIHDNTITGIELTTANNYVKNSLIYNNTGASSDGIFGDLYLNLIEGNTIDQNGRDGIRYASFAIPGTISNNIVTRNAGIGINFAAQSPAAVVASFDYNFFGTSSLANTGGAYGVYLAGPHDLAGDPQYVNAATGDFTPQNTAVRAAYPSGWIGAVQPTSSSSAATVAYPFFQ